MLLAARALTYLADVLPSSCSSIVRHGAVPAFCARLLTIEYIDLAEQSLQVRLEASPISVFDHQPSSILCGSQYNLPINLPLCCLFKCLMSMSCSCRRHAKHLDQVYIKMQALEKLSHEHPQAVLRQGGLVAVLSYLDFFQTGVQRVAVATAATMCRSLTTDNIDAVSSAVPILTNLLQYQVCHSHVFAMPLHRKSEILKHL